MAATLSKRRAIWQADHTPLDIELVQYDLDPTRTAKPWLTVILDDYSRALVGYFLSLESPSSLNTLALRQAIWGKEDARWKVCGILPARRFAPWLSNNEVEALKLARHPQPL